LNFLMLGFHKYKALAKVVVEILKLARHNKPLQEPTGWNWIHAVEKLKGISISEILSNVRSKAIVQTNALSWLVRGRDDMCMT